MCKVRNMNPTTLRAFKKSSRLTSSYIKILFSLFLRRAKDNTKSPQGLKSNLVGEIKYY